MEKDRERLARLAELGELVGSVLHELRNPLGVIESSVYLIQQKPDDTVRRDKHLSRIAEQVMRARHVIAGLMSLLSDQPLDTEPVDIAALALDALSTLEQRVPVDVETQPMSVVAEPILLRQAIANLVDNALCAAKSRVRISTQRVGANVELVVYDDGSGVPADLRDRLFQPLASGRPDGTGLGLALSRRIVERLGGTLRYDDTGGTRFVLTLRACT